MELTEKQLKSAVKRYNNIMWGLCYEHNTIGTELSESTDKWNLRDMVAECDYVLSTYYESGHVNGDMRYSDAKAWRSETGKLRRFIDRYEPYTSDMVCSEGHCSRFD